MHSLAGLNERTSVRFSPHRASILVLGILAAVAALYVLDATSDAVRWATLGLVVLVLLLWAIRTTYFDPKWLVLALIMEEMLPYLNIVPLDPESGRWFLRLPLLVAFAIPAVFITWRSDVKWRGGFRLMWIYFAWAAISVAYSLTPVVSGGRLVADCLEFVTLIASVSSVETEDDVQKLIGIFLVGCAALEVLSLVAFFTFPSNLTWVNDEAGISRFSGIGNTPNVMGELLLVTVGSALVHWKVMPRWQRVSTAIVIAMSVVFAVMADSRSVFVAMGLGISAYSVWRYRLKGAAIILLLTVAAVGIYGTIGASSRTYVNRDVTTMTGRTYAWQFELHKIAQHPLIGYGYYVEGQIFQDPHFTNWGIFWDQGPDTTLHNSYLSVAVGLGVPALLLWIYLFAKPCWWLFKRAKGDPWYLKEIFFFVILPAVIMGFDESGLATPRYVKGVLVFLCWMLMERRRLSSTRVVVLEPHIETAPFALKMRSA